jgi:acyl carrier protein
VNSLADFLALIRTELGLPVTEEDATRDLYEVAGWDSLHLLWLVTALEQRTGRTASVVDLIDARNLSSIYHLVSAA